MLESLSAHAQRRGKPYTGKQVAIKGQHLPADYWSVVGVANGFATSNFCFRLLAIDEARAFNQSDAVEGYGDLLTSFVVVAEDIFGDLYGYENNELVKFRCEGGEKEACNPTQLSEFLGTCVLIEAPTAFDLEMAQEAFRAGLRCGPTEHLAFEVPLIAGGEYSIDNLGVEERDLHLGILGQLTLSTRDLPEGTELQFE